MDYSSDQLQTLHQVRSLLRKAGLESEDLENLPSSPSSDHSHNSAEFKLSPLKYIPPPAYFFSPEEIHQGAGRVTVKSSVQAIIDHPCGAIVEYLETSTLSNVAIGHRFPTFTDFVNPRGNIQYSLGGVHAIRHNVTCYLLQDLETGERMECKQTKLSCCGIKRCNFVPDIYPSDGPIAVNSDSGAQEEVFMKTLGFYCALQEQGCCIGSFYNELDEEENDEDSIYEQCPTDSIEAVSDHSRVSKLKKCKGALILSEGKFKRPFISCELYGCGTRGHLILRNLGEYDLGYLRALFNKDKYVIRNIEEKARDAGYGPLVPCVVTTACREQKDLCSFWHRGSNGILQRGQMVNFGECPSRFEIYEPYDLQKCPFILLVCRHPHSHPHPTRTRTPKSISNIFAKLLDHLEWRLADATPRRILLDNAFMSGLRQVLQWSGICDPTLNDLHPSLANSDHVARLINKLRFERYPQGTGLAGAKLLLSQHLVLPPDDRYIRCIEAYNNPIDGEFHIIICMFPAMSHLLLKTKRPSIDTSFKRLHGWQEFEIEAWFSGYERSIVVARAFTTSQSAEAHRLLFRQIFKIAAEDTGEEVKFRHIHGSGIDTVTADGHRGQALGLGLYCQEICQRMPGYCMIEKTRLLSSLTPTEHLARFYRYCFAHYTRNVSNLKGHVSSEVRTAMLSLASSEPLPDFDAVLSIIRNGGKKAIDWLKDKQSSDSFALKGIYQPASSIPIEIWCAAPPTSNGNEQAHRNINRDGTKLTMLAGIMRGLQYDSRAIISMDTFIREGIYSRDRRFTHFRRASRAIRKKGSIQHKNISIKDDKIYTNYEKVLELQRRVQTTATAVKRALESPQPRAIEPAQRRLRKILDQLKKHRKELDQLKPQGSGTVLTPGLLEPMELFDQALLQNIPQIQNPLTYCLPISQTISLSGTFSPRHSMAQPMASTYAHPNNSIYIASNSTMASDDPPLAQFDRMFTQYTPHPQSSFPVYYYNYDSSNFQ